MRNRSREERIADMEGKLVIELNKNERIKRIKNALVQYDHGVTLEIHGLSLPSTLYIYFSSVQAGGKAVKQIATTTNGVTTCKIPDSVLRNSGTVWDYEVFAYIYVVGVDFGKTEHILILETTARSREDGGEDLAPEEESLLTQTLASINNRLAADQGAGNAGKVMVVGNDGILTPQEIIDDTLTKFGLAADAAKTGEIFNGVKGDLRELNCFELMNDFAYTPSYYRGITWEIMQDKSIKASGTATEDTFLNMWIDRNSLPSVLKKGVKYHVSYSAQKVQINVWFYKNGTYISGLTRTESFDFFVPDDAEGLIFRLAVLKGISVDEIATLSVKTTKSNRELSAMVDVLNTNSFQFKGVLSNDVDLDTLNENGVWLLAGNVTAPTPKGTLLHQNTSDSTKIQILYRFGELNVFYRHYTMGNWVPWEDTDTKYEKKYPLSKKYIAFGDSLTWGALWNDGTPVVTRATEGSRIPDRIANAVNCKDYDNYGVGGMAITTESGGIPKFIDWIKSKDISSADLITFMGGRNDGSALLGTKDSTEGDGSICGGIKEIINYIRSQNKTCQIVIIQVTPYTSENDPWNARSSSGWTLNTFDEQVSALCKDLNVCYCNWYGCSLFSCWSDLSGGDGNFAHMRTNKGYEQMGNFIGGKVAKFFSN